MIKVANINDLEICSRMALEFIRKTAYALFYDEGRVVGVVKQILQESPTEKVILLGLHESKIVGMLVGIKVPFIYGLHSNATELAWWVDEEYRTTGVGKELLEGFEYWALKANCKTITMISIDDTLGKYYEKLGYTLVERAYMKEISE